MQLTPQGESTSYVELDPPPPQIPHYIDRLYREVHILGLSKIPRWGHTTDLDSLGKATARSYIPDVK